MWDIFFISYGESNCESNWRRLCEFHPNAKRIHGITGIDRAHRTVNELADTPYFWVIDGDNYLLRPLEWQEEPDVDLLMFKTVDPLCDDLTALGAPKLWRTGSFINRDMSRGDFTLYSVKTKRVVDHHFTIGLYNATPWETWKTAFRHVVKLSSVILGTRDPQYATNIDRYLHNWRNTQHHPGANSRWAYLGYCDAIEYSRIHNPNMAELNRINNYRWLKQYWDGKYHSSAQTTK